MNAVEIPIPAELPKPLEPNRNLDDVLAVFETSLDDPSTKEEALKLAYRALAGPIINNASEPGTAEARLRRLPTYEDDKVISKAYIIVLHERAKQRTDKAFSALEKEVMKLKDPEEPKSKSNLRLKKRHSR